MGRSTPTRQPHLPSTKMTSPTSHPGANSSLPLSPLHFGPKLFESSSNRSAVRLLASRLISPGRSPVFVTCHLQLHRPFHTGRFTKARHCAALAPIHPGSELRLPRYRHRLSSFCSISFFPSSISMHISSSPFAIPSSYKPSLSFLDSRHALSESLGGSWEHRRLPLSPCACSLMGPAAGSSAS